MFFDLYCDRSFYVLGLQASLERLQLSYVDIIFVNKADPMCPMEGIVIFTLVLSNFFNQLF